MKASTALAGGLAGTFTVALIHESLKKITPAAPRMELLDMDALSKVLKSINVKLPEQHELLKLTTAGEIVSHTLYFSLVGTGNKKSVWLKGLLSGLFAGITAVALPKPLGLNQPLSNRTPKTEIMTIGMYLFGGLAASGACKYLTNK